MHKQIHFTQIIAQIKFLVTKKGSSAGNITFACDVTLNAFLLLRWEFFTPSPFTQETTTASAGARGSAGGAECQCERENVRWAVAPSTAATAPAGGGRSSKQPVRKGKMRKKTEL